MAKVSTRKALDTDLQFESSKAILNDHDLELIIMYLENKARSKCGFDIDDYRLLNKYSINVKFERVADKSAVLKDYENDLLDLKIKDFNLTLNQPIDDLIMKQEDKFKNDNKMLIIYDVKDRTKNDVEFREQLVDAFTSDTDKCVHASIEFSKIFDSCMYVKYNTEFDRYSVSERYKAPRLANNSEFLFAYENMNYLVLKIKNNEKEIDVIDRLKSDFNFKSVRPINNNKLILLEFKNLKDMNIFLNDYSNKYLVEPVYNLALLNYESIIENNNEILVEYQEHEIIIDNHLNLQLFALDKKLIKNLEKSLNEIESITTINCLFSENKLIIKFKSKIENKKSDIIKEVNEIIDTFLNEAIKATKVQFNFANFISEDDNILKSFLNELCSNEDVYIKSHNLKESYIEIYGSKDNVEKFLAKINSTDARFLKDDVYKIRVLFTDKKWLKLKESFEKSPNNVIKAKPKEQSVEFKGKLIDCLFALIYSKDVISRIQKLATNFSEIQINFLKSKEEKILKIFRTKSIYIVLDFSEEIKLYLCSVNGNYFQNAITELLAFLSQNNF